MNVSDVLVNIDNYNLQFSPAFYRSFFQVPLNQVGSTSTNTPPSPYTTTPTELPLSSWTWATSQENLATLLQQQQHVMDDHAMDDVEALRSVIFEPDELSHETGHQYPPVSTSTLFASPPASPSKKRSVRRFSPVSARQVDDYGHSLITQLKEEIWLFLVHPNMSKFLTPHNEVLQINAEDLWAWIVQRVPQIKESKYRPCILKHHSESVFARYKEQTAKQLELVYNVKRGRKRKSFSAPVESNMLPPSSKRRYSVP